jgi:hypothetical protein
MKGHGLNHRRVYPNPNPTSIESHRDRGRYSPGSRSQSGNGRDRSAWVSLISSGVAVVVGRVLGKDRASRLFVVSFAVEAWRIILERLRNPKKSEQEHIARTVHEANTDQSAPMDVLQYGSGEDWRVL